MNWAEYYKNRAISFKNQAHHYKDALTTLDKHQPEVLDPSIPKNIMLGGFHPTNGTPEQFTIFCQGFFPHPGSQFIYLDKNSRPFNGFVSGPNRIPYQLPLEHVKVLPAFLRPIDLLILDFTLPYMDDQSIARFAAAAPTVLSRNGLILTATVSPDLKSLWEDSLDGGRQPVTYNREYFRTIEEVEKLMINHSSSLLRPVYSRKSLFGHEDIIAFSRLDSDFPKRKLEHPDVLFLE